SSAPTVSFRSTVTRVTDVSSFCAVAVDREEVIVSSMCVFSPLIPAKAGIRRWVPAFAGTSGFCNPSHPPRVRVPAALEILDQLMIVQAAALLAHIGRHVAAENRQRLFGDSQRLAITDGTRHAGPRQLRGVGLNRRVHPGGRNDLIADPAAFRRIS